MKMRTGTKQRNLAENRHWSTRKAVYQMNDTLLGIEINTINDESVFYCFLSSSEPSVGGVVISVPLT